MFIDHCLHIWISITTTNGFLTPQIAGTNSYGFMQVGVYRMSSEQIGCSLADAASSSEYTHFLREASGSFPSLHVIYINTSLETKAHAHELVPTITCTSSNVVPTILQVNVLLLSITYWRIFCSLD